MNNYTRTLEIAAPVAKVYQAITTQNGLRNWWTNTCDAGTAVGERSTFRFDEIYNVMQIEKLVPDAEVQWRCVEQYHPLEKSTNEWVGTTVIFRLTPVSDSSTSLEFEHVGLNQKLECYGICENGWNHFLGSLKNYAETGKGSPYQAA